MEQAGIRLVDLKQGDYGLPAPGFLFDTGMPEKSTERARAWARELLQMRRSCADARRPVCPVYVIGPRQEEILELVAAVLPRGVAMVREGTPSAPSGLSRRRVSTASIFYLVAP